MENTEQIVKGCLEGRREAQRALYNLYQRRMYAVCLRYAASRAEAEDMAQEGFIKVFRNLHQYKNTGPLEAWIRRIMVNTALEKFKKTAPLFVGSDVADYSDVVSYDDIQSHLSAADIIRMVQELPPQYRLVFNLYEMDGYSHAEIAGMLSITESTSRSNLTRAKVILQKKIINQFPGMDAGQNR